MWVRRISTGSVATYFAIYQVLKGKALGFGRRVFYLSFVIFGLDPGLLSMENKRSLRRSSRCGAEVAGFHQNASFHAFTSESESDLGAVTS